VEHIQLARFSRARSPLPAAPWLLAAACALGAGALLGFGIAGGLVGSALLTAPISIALLGVVLAARNAHDRHRLRTEADAWIGRGYESPHSRYAWRIAELTNARERRLLARTLRSVVDDIDGPRLVGAPLDRKAVGPSRGKLVALANRLEALPRPVSAGGVLGVQRLITDGRTSPFYVHDVSSARNVAAELTSLLERLEVRG
jgi:hypothetical protein